MNQPNLIEPTEAERTTLQTEFFDAMRAIRDLDNARKVFLASNRDARKKHQTRALQIMRTLNGEAEE
jgi:glycine cleavage system protein P-like pyridoxal-binding family